MKGRAHAFNGHDQHQERDQERPEASFCADHFHGGELAARTLIEHGHRALAVIGGPPTSSDNAARLHGFFAELARHGIERKTVPHIVSDFSPDGGYAPLHRALLHERHDGHERTRAPATSRVARARGRLRDRVRRRLFSHYMAPALTSVHIPTAELTRNAVRWLINQCYGTQWPIERTFAVSVTMRDSVVRAK